MCVLWKKRFVGCETVPLINDAAIRRLQLWQQVEPNRVAIGFWIHDRLLPHVNTMDTSYFSTLSEYDVFISEWFISSVSVGLRVSLLYVAEVNKYHESLPATTLFYTPSVKHTNPLFMVTQQTDTTVILGSFIGHHRWGTTAHSPNPCFRLTNRESLSQLVLEIPRLVLLTKKKPNKKKCVQNLELFICDHTAFSYCAAQSKSVRAVIVFAQLFNLFSRALDSKLNYGWECWLQTFFLVFFFFFTFSKF